MTGTITTAGPEVVRHALNYYDTLDANSKDVEHQGRTVRVFTGSLTKVWSEVKASNAHYTNCTTLLIESGAVAVLQRGARGQPTVALLVRRPSEDELASVPLTKAGPSATVELGQRIDNIEKRLGGLDIVDALKNIEQRLTEVERELNGKTT